MLGDISLNTSPRKLEVFLCKPDLNRTTIAKLTEANISQNIDNYSFNIITYRKNYKFANIKTFKETYGGINELTLQLPLWVDYDGVLTKNPHFDLVRERYLIRVVSNSISEYFIIKSIEKSMDKNSDMKIVTCYGLAYELSDKIVTLEFTSKNPQEMLNTILGSTLWNVSYIDSEFLLKFRSLSISNSTVLGAIGEVINIFNAVILYDTVNRTISLYKQENLGLDKHLIISGGKFLDSLNYSYDFENVCTRLKIFGKDNISINSQNPTGANYIDNFSWFFGSFQQDSVGNVISHSEYFSDELAIALKVYISLVESKQGIFDDLLFQLETQEEILITKNNELTVFQDQLLVLQDSLDVANSSSQSTTTILAQISAKQIEINTKNDEINVVNNEIININNQISNLGNQLSMSQNFSENELKELNQFVIERTYTNDSISDPKDLLEAGKQYFSEISTPPITLKCSIVDILSMVDQQYSWDGLGIGNIVTVKYPNLSINVKAKIIEIYHDYENQSIEITVSNVKDVLSPQEKVIKQLNNVINTSASLNMDAYKWNNSVATVDDVTTILNNKWSSAEREITSGVNESVTMNRRGIKVVDSSDPLKFIQIMHGVIGFTADGGNTFKTAIDPSGVYAQYLVGQIILGNKLVITDDTGKFTITGNLLTVKDNNNVVRVLLGNYNPANNKYGIKIMDATGNVTILDEDGIMQSWQDSRADNADASHGLTLNIYLPSETKSIHKALLRFKLLPFRAYETGASSGGSGSPTSGPSSESSSGASSESSTVSASEKVSIGIYTLIPGPIVDYTQRAGLHNHGIADATALKKDPTGVTYFYESGEHYHPLPNHGHSLIIEGHSHNMPHTHNINHYHTVNINPHTHEINFGIYESSSPSNVTVKVNYTTIGTYYSNQNSINIANYLTMGAWNTITITPNQLGRIDSSIFVQAKMGV